MLHSFHLLLVTPAKLGYCDFHLHKSTPGPSCSEHRKLNNLINDKHVNCCSQGIFKYIDIVTTHIFSAKNINVFAIFEDRNFS